MAANLFSSMPLSLSRYRSAAMREQIVSVLNASRFDNIVCDFLSPAPNFETLANCVLFQHNVETMIWRRHADNAPDPLRKLYFKLQAERMFHWERRMCSHGGRGHCGLSTGRCPDAQAVRVGFGLPHTHRR